MESWAVFPSIDGLCYMPDQITNCITEFMEDAGVDASLHSLRHFSASMMLANNVPITMQTRR
jgi:integrase